MVRIPITNRRAMASGTQTNGKEAGGATGQDVQDREQIHFGSANDAPPEPLPADFAGAERQHDSTGTYERTTGEPGPSDPTIPPGVERQTGAGDQQFGVVEGEVAGAGSGATTPGGELTPGQDAGAALEEMLDNRTGYEQIQFDQMEGEVTQQTQDLKPSAANPDEGLGANPTGSENASNAPNPVDQQDETGPSAQTTARAASEHDERYLRLAAEFQNYKQAVTRRESEVRERAVRNVLEDLLPVLDNFERAIEAVRSANDANSLNGIRAGVEGILMQMQGVLKNNGVEMIAAQGQAFDPLHHEAIAQVSDSGHQEGTVVDEAQRGYLYKGQVLRPARVRVAG